jgi:hypothetical protein
MGAAYEFQKKHSPQRNNLPETRAIFRRGFQPCETRGKKKFFLFPVDLYNYNGFSFHAPSYSDNFFI